MAIRQKEYLFSTNEFNEPASLTGKSAIGLLLVRLILMDPGSDPLHPTMGVGIRKYRYGLDNINELKKSVEEQIETFLPCYQNASVAMIITPDRVCNIEITINDTVYVYDSHTAPIPISLTDIENN
jgi:hypothetical protein